MKAGHRWSEEQYDYLREIAEGRYNDEIAELMNKKFGTSFTESQIKNAKVRKKIRSNVPRVKPNKFRLRLFTKEQFEFIVANVKGRTNQELAVLVNEKFDLNVTAQQMNTFKKNHDLRSGLDLRFKKGQSPWNKGLKGLQIGGEETQFKKGQRPHNYRPVGSERVCSKDGYVLLKVQDDGKFQERWRHKHVVVWEKAYGPVPDGHVVMFLDQNKLNISLDNLVLIEQRQLSILNRKNLLTSDADLNRTSIAVAKLFNKISDRKEKSS